MIINQANLGRLYTVLSTAFNRGLGLATSQWNQIATKVPSTTREEKYGWLGKVPNVREWIGDRVIHGISAHDYAIKNKSWELTLGVDRDDIEDDTYGVYNPLFEEMGMSTASHPDSLIFALLKAGFTTACYDGQNFFDTDHPVLDEDGVVQSVANTDAGSGTPWFLVDSSRALKPILYQVRKEFNFVRKDKPEDDNVFERKEYLYGVEGRSNVGFGFWQFAWGSKQTLNATYYKAAREGLQSMKSDHGRPLGIMPKLLIVPPSLEAAGLTLLNAEHDAAGATNIYRGTASLLVVPWLA